MEKITAKPTIKNVDLTSADTEVSYELPQHTNEFSVRLRDIGFLLKVAMVEGESGTTYFTVQNGETHKEVGVKASKVTLFLQSPEASMVAEILSFE